MPACLECLESPWVVYPTLRLLGYLVLHWVVICPVLLCLELLWVVVYLVSRWVVIYLVLVWVDLPMLRWQDCLRCKVLACLVCLVCL